MNVLIDKDGFYTGGYSEIGAVTPLGGELIIEAPIPTEQDYMKSKAYKWTGSSWEFIQSKYDELLNEEKAEQEKVRAENQTIQSLQSKVEYLSMMTGVSLDV